METRAHSTPGAALLLRLALGAALGLVFLLASLIFGSSSARADEAPAAEPGLLTSLVERVETSLVSSLVERVETSLVERVETTVPVVPRLVSTVVTPLVSQLTTPVLDAPAPPLAIPPVEPVGTEPALLESIASPSSTDATATAQPAPAEDHSAPVQPPVAPYQSTLSPGPSLGSGASGSGAVADLGSFGVRGPEASSIAFSPEGFSPPGAPTFASDATPD